MKLMERSLKSRLEVGNFLIALIALIFSILSVIYTWHSNRMDHDFKVNITEDSFNPIRIIDDSNYTALMIPVRLKVNNPTVDKLMLDRVFDFNQIPGSKGIINKMEETNLGELKLPAVIEPNTTKTIDVDVELPITRDALVKIQRLYNNRIYDNQISDSRSAFKYNLQKVMVSDSMNLFDRIKDDHDSLAFNFTSAKGQVVYRYYRLFLP
jgi:hypothetical protein